MKRFLCLTVVATLFAVSNERASAQTPAAAKHIDVVICLDVSGSMQGLIDSAKTKLWDIVNQLAKIKPAPELRVGLYSYGSPAYGVRSGYVRKELDLSTDLDMLYQKLFALTIDGGDEYASRVSLAAVEQQKWSTAKDALKIIFVCGNEPANQDPIVKMKEAADKAIAAGIVVNTIYCGNADDGDAASWREFGSLAGGRFAAIDQAKGTVVVATPFDKKLAELGEKLGATYVSYGKEGKKMADNQVEQTKNAAKLGAGTAASRTISLSSAVYRSAGWDLVDKVKEDPKFDVTKVPDDELCDELRKMKPAERVAHVKEMTAKRAALQKEVADLTREREAYIRKELRRRPSEADSTFDAAIQEAIRTQAATRGIVIPRE